MRSGRRPFLFREILLTFHKFGIIRRKYMEPGICRGLFPAVDILLFYLTKTSSSNIVRNLISLQELKGISMEIILIRHGKPTLPKSEWLRSSEFRRWLGKYNECGVSAKIKPTEELSIKIQKCRMVITSHFHRARTSAQMLFPRSQLHADPLFNEAGLPSANMGAMPLPFYMWIGLFRSLWFLGYCNGVESTIKARERARVAAGKLREYAEQHGTVALVGHGVFNALIAKELNTTGWRGPRVPCTKYWSFGTYNFAP